MEAIDRTLVWLRTLLLVGSLLGLSAAAAQPRHGDVDIALQDYESTVDRAVALSDADQHAQADAALGDVLSRPLLFRLPQQRQHDLFAAATWTALKLGDAERGRVLAAKAIAIDPDYLHDWLWLSHAEAQLGNADAAAMKLARALRRRPGWLGQIDEATLAQRVFQAEPGSRGRHVLLQTLFGLDWSRGGRGASTFWYEHALAQMSSGSPADAKQAIERIDTPIELLKLRIDRRFDALIERDSPRFDVEAAAAHHVTKLRALAQEQPRSLQTVNELLDALLIAGADEDALSLSAATVAALEAASKWEEPFDDMDESNWLRNLRASALIRSGAHEAAVAEMQRARALKEQGEANTSQTLNLAHYLVALGRIEPARAALDQVGDMSPYGRMVLASARHRIGLLAKDARQADDALEYLIAHRDDLPMAHVQALADADRLDAAATALIAMLDSPAERGDALLALQSLRESESLPGEREFRARWDTLAALPSVLAAVQRVGRIEQAAIYDR